MRIENMDSMQPLIEHREEFEVEQIIGMKVDKIKNSIQFQVRWVGYDECDDSWIPIEDLSCESLIEKFLDASGRRTEYENVLQAREKNIFRMKVPGEGEVNTDLEKDEGPFCVTKRRKISENNGSETEANKVIKIEPYSEKWDRQVKTEIFEDSEEELVPQIQDDFEVLKTNVTEQIVNSVNPLVIKPIQSLMSPVSIVASEGHSINGTFVTVGQKPHQVSSSFQSHSLSSTSSGVSIDNASWMPPSTSSLKTSTKERRDIAKLPSTLQQDSSNSTSENEDIDLSRIPSFGLKSWSGHLNFSIHFPPGDSSSEWCYNSEMNKMYAVRATSIPIEFMVDTWEDAIINVTGVFLRSQHWAEAVVRCHNHRLADEAKGLANPSHMIQVIDSNAVHKTIENKCSVEIPLGRPAPGERSRVIHIVCNCWNTCVSPCKKNIMLIFTLFGKNGREIGRQVVNFKSCQCPFRDMAIDMQRPAKLANRKKPLPGAKESPNTIIKTEHSFARDPIPEYETVRIPSNIASDVKKYINCLMAERFIKDNMNFTPPFPDV